MRSFRILLTCILLAAGLAAGWAAYSIFEPTTAIAGCTTSC
jgi:hypothetical protein